MNHDGIDRRYILHVPDGYLKNPSPLVISFHGGGGDADSAVHYFQWNDKSDEEGFIVAYPEGTGQVLQGKLLGTWNGGDCCGYAHENQIDDVGFIQSMIEIICTDFNIDTHRIYATGMSNGAIMVYWLACELSDTFAAIAPHSSIGHFSDCNLARTIPTLHIHGKLDPCAAYDGCTQCESCFVNFVNEYYTQCLSIPTNLSPQDAAADSVPDFIDRWRTINGCTDEKATTWSHAQGRCETYAQCPSGEIVLCTIDDMGHTWSGRDTYSPEACAFNPDGCVCSAWKDAVGELSQTLEANDVIWEFFKKHSRYSDGE